MKPHVNSLRGESTISQPTWKGKPYPTPTTQPNSEKIRS